MYSLLLTTLLLSQTAPDRGAVVLPLDSWERLEQELKAYQRPHTPPWSVLPQQVAITGEFKQGVFHGQLTYQFEVPAGVLPEGVSVPFIGSEAVVDSTLLDGKAAGITRQGAMFAMPAIKAGVHRIEARFFLGSGAERFVRALSLGLPESSVATIQITIPEADIEPALEGGVITSKHEVGGKTELTGAITQNRLELRWQRRLTHRTAAEFLGSYNLFALFELQQGSVAARQQIDVRVLQGETDRLDLRVPAGVQVVEVEGEPVLQWRLDKDREQHDILAVFLRYLVAESTSITVRLHQPVSEQAATDLKLVWPASAKSVSAMVGIQAPVRLEIGLPEVPQCSDLAGLDLSEAAADAPGAKGSGTCLLPQRKLPRNLTNLNDKPLLAGYHVSSPEGGVAVRITENQDVSLTTTIIDAWHASTVLLEDGTEVTKLHLRMRNNARQYLAVTMPAGAVITHALLDGEVIAPAVANDRKDVIMLPLRQSERQKELWHRVHFGETLSHIASYYYSDPGGWQRILRANNLAFAHQVRVGQRLRIPRVVSGGKEVEESSFVIELAYRLSHDRPGFIGSQQLTLPLLDAQAVEFSWNVYLPEVIEPLSFTGSIRQYSHIRYDVFRRAIAFFEEAMHVRRAWAGGGSEMDFSSRKVFQKENAAYFNILDQRKVIYHDEQQKLKKTEIVSSFPLVGVPYHFKRLFLNVDRPELTVTYLRAEGQYWLRLLALALAIALMLYVLLSAKRWSWRAAVFLVGLAGLLVLAHFILGVHRRLLLGFDVALLLYLARGAWPRWRSSLLSLWQAPPSPLLLLSWTLWWRLTTAVVLLAVLTSYPLFMSSITLVLLATLAVRGRLRPSAPAGNQGGAP